MVTSQHPVKSGGLGIRRVASLALPAFLAWDMLAPSYVAVSAQIIGSAAQAAAERKVSKYDGLSASHIFVATAFETLSPMNEAGHSFLSELDRRLATISNDPRESFFLI